MFVEIGIWDELESPSSDDCGVAADARRHESVGADVGTEIAASDFPKTRNPTGTEHLMAHSRVRMEAGIGGEG